LRHAASASQAGGRRHRSRRHMSRRHSRSRRSRGGFVEVLNEAMTPLALTYMQKRAQRRMSRRARR
jgi:hypothetical protein